MLHRLPLWRWVCKFFNTNTSRTAVHSKEEKKGNTPQGVGIEKPIIAIFQNQDLSIETAQIILESEYLGIVESDKYNECGILDRRATVVVFQKKRL